MTYSCSIKPQGKLEWSKHSLKEELPGEVNRHLNQWNVLCHSTYRKRLHELNITKQNRNLNKKIHTHIGEVPHRWHTAEQENIFNTFQIIYFKKF